MNAFDYFLRVVAKVMVHTVQRPKLLSAKPKIDQPTIFVGRHVGLIDPVVLMMLYFRKMIKPLVAKDYFYKNKFTKFFYTHAQCIPIDRKKASKQWLEDSVETLHKGQSIIIFPEGKRNKSGEGLLPFHSGAALLAQMSGARIIPVYNEAWKFPHRYRLAIGEPFFLENMPEGKDRQEWLKEQTELIRNSVAALKTEDK